MRLGNADHPGAMAVVMSNGADGDKWMNAFRPGKTFYDLKEHVPGKLQTNQDGWGQFQYKGGKDSVWLQE